MGMILVNRQVVQVDQNFRTHMGMHHRLLVHLHLETDVSIIVRICKTLRLDQTSPKVVWNKEKIGLLHVLSVVETTPVNVVMCSKGSLHEIVP